MRSGSITAAHTRRRVILEFGRRFAENSAIDQQTDVFYLTLEELHELASALPSGGQRSRIGARQAELAHFRTIAPPRARHTASRAARK
jgi:hypothetical protein